jgi:hypothetical protein
MAPIVHPAVGAIDDLAGQPLAQDLEPAQSSYQLLIIGPEAWRPALRALVDHKNDTSMPARLMTIEEIDNDYTGYDLPEKIKRAIEEEHHLREVKYVMLVGDSDVFPLRWGYVDIPTAPLSCASGFPWRFDAAYGSADAYYADLYEADGSTFESWDFDGDHKYGETGTNWCTGANADRVNFYMDVVVGRVPASTLTETVTYVNKVIQYEYVAGYGGSWTDDALIIAGSFGDSNTGNKAKDIAAKAPSLKTKVLDHNASGCPANALPNPTNINAALDDGVLLMVYLGHGSGAEVMGIGTLCDNSSGDYDVPDQIDSPTGPDNDPMWPVVLNFACENGQYGPPVPWNYPYVDVDGYERDYGCNPICFPTPLEPEEPAPLQEGNATGGAAFDRESTAEAFLVRSDDGAIAEIATYGFGDNGNWVMAETFFGAYESGTRILGELWKTTMHDFIGKGNVDDAWHLRHLKHYHLFGDPSLRVGGVAGLKGMPPQVTVSEPAADAPVFSNNPDTNYGNTSTMGFLNYPGDYMSRSVIRFRTPDLPPSSTISLGEMSLYALTADPPSDWNELYELNGSWDEMTVTWNNQPGQGSLLFSANFTPTDFTYYTWDVFTSVDGWVNQGAANDGWLLRGQEDTQYIYTFATREHSEYPHPQLVVKAQMPCPAKILLDALFPLLGIHQGSADTLYRLRDEWLANTPRGQHLIDLFYTHALEMVILFLEDPSLVEEGVAVLGMTLPGLDALVNGEGDAVMVTPEMAEGLDLFVSHLHGVASPELQAAIEAEWERNDPFGLVGLPFGAAWQVVAGQWTTNLPLQYGPPGSEPEPEDFHFMGNVYLGEPGDTSNPLDGVDLVLYGSSGRHGPHQLLATTQSAGDGAFAFYYEATAESAFAYYSLAISDTGYIAVGVEPGGGGEEWEPFWIQYSIPVAGDYGGNRFFAQERGR